MTALAIVGVLGLMAGSVLALNRRTVGLSLVVQIAAASALVASAVAVLAGHASIGAAFRADVGPAFGIDGLSAFFVAVVCATAVPALLVARDTLRESPHARPLASLSGIFLLAMIGVLIARDVTTFLAGWELMTLVPAGMILVARRDAIVRRAVFVYLAITHLGGAGVWIALLTLAHENAFGGALTGTGPQAFVALMAIIGFGTKAGLMPMHSWLPRAHPVAPTHISALMSGVMIKVALYGLIRVLFEWIGPAPSWIGIVLLSIGVLSCLGGVLYAIVQHELKRLLAFHSIENVGIIALGLGAALILRAQHEPFWGAIAFGAALLHTANHAAFKALLFLGAGAFGNAVGSLELDRLGGLLRRMPWTGWCFVVGCAAIAGLPPLNGFASEWLTLQVLLHVSFVDHAGISIAGALATAGLAVTAALALYCFVKVVGLVLLGTARTPRAAQAEEVPKQTRAAMLILAGACGVLGLTPGLLLPTLAGLAPGGVDLDRHIGIDLPGTGGLPSLGIAIVLALVTTIVWRLAGAKPRALPAPTWTCGQPVVSSLGWTSVGFTKPLGLALETFFRPRRRVEVTGRGALITEVVHRTEVPHLFDTAIYGPVNRGALHLASIARRMQSGSLPMYLAYLLGMVIALLAFVRLGVL